jgi:hypothetical protein
MKNLGRQLILAAACAIALSGCVMAHAPVMAPITLNERGPVGGGSAVGSAKTGRATATGILFFAHGDASVSAAMANGGITRVHHVDHETTNIMGFYAKYTTIVYGE